jgi:hypothetical protein
MLNAANLTAQNLKNALKKLNERTQGNSEGL